MVGATTVKGSTEDIFALEDELTTAAMALLSPQLTAGQHRRPSASRRRDVPANPRAFELFLRAWKKRARSRERHRRASSFSRPSTPIPDFAPAWAALGRAHRVWGKYYSDREESNRLAEQAFQRALELSPDLPVLHRFITPFESESGRAADAIARLLKHARTNRQDPQPFAGLVHACRYAGLFEASLAAHHEARRLDPNVATGVEYTLALLARNADQASDLLLRHTGSPDTHFALAAIGDAETAKRALDALDLRLVPPAFRLSVDAVFASYNLPAAEAVKMIESAMASHVDPEALFLFGAMLIRVGEPDRGLEVSANAVRSGYTPALTIAQNHTFDPVRGPELFRKMEDEARAAMLAAQKIFEAAGGPEMLGTPAAARLNL